MQRLRKKPADYPQFTFRVTEEEKEQLHQLIDEVTELYNKFVPEDQYAYRKNDIIKKALEIGLAQMKKNPPKK